ncbi:ABC transporter permease [Pseudonocardiaceae bacterium YIM PH 21723]|nr:ABC transporter permease [Pseudonocardiaceae bacterium YIM PH 21723]
MRLALTVLRRDRRSQVATVLVALGVMIAVSLVLWLLAAPGGLETRSDRAAWRAPWSGSGSSEAMKINMAATKDSFEGRLVERFDVARQKPGTVPVAAGIARFPESGEVLLSPALAELVRGTAPERLGNRFPGKVIGELGPEALQFPGELVAIIGRDAVSNGIPAAGLTAGWSTGSEQDMLYLLTRVGLVVLVAPCLVLVGSAARLTAAKRERRLAALRLAGATPRQVVQMTVIETAVGAVAGSLLGVLLVRPFSYLTTMVPWAGGTWYPDDFVPGLPVVAAVALLAPVLVVGAAILGLRRVVTRPLAVEEQRKARTARLLLIGLAIAVLFVGVQAVNLRKYGSNGMLVLLAGVGGVALALVLGGPVVTGWVGRFFVGRWRGPATLLAGRRLSGDPVAAFRGSAGVVLAVFTGSMALTMLPSLQDRIQFVDQTWNRDVIIASDVTTDLAPLRRATTAPVVAMVEGRGSDSDPQRSGDRVIVGRCAEVAQVLNGLTCRPGAAVYAPEWFHAGQVEAGRQSGKVTAALPAVYETRPFRPQGSVTAVIDLDLVPALAGQRTLVALPTTPENRDVVHTAIVGALPGARLLDTRIADRWSDTLMGDLQRATVIGLSIAAALGAIGTAVAAAGSVIDRRRAFAALIAAGTPVRVLAHALRREVVIPVIAVTMAACGAGVLVGLALLTVGRAAASLGDFPITAWVFAPPAVGVLVALVAALACGPVLRGISPRDYASE